jgi:transcriptional regulator with XRE-family HTH domain
MRNLKELRGRMPVRELSRHLAELGRPILASGITKIEQGTRRIDVDDLVALALTLGVSPNRLLLDPDADDAELLLTDASTWTRRQSWDWATGASPLPDADRDQDSRDFDGLFEFRRVNRPNEPGSRTPLGELDALGVALGPVLKAVQDVVAAGAVRFEQVIEYLELHQTFQRVAAIAEETQTAAVVVSESKDQPTPRRKE